MNRTIEIWTDGSCSPFTKRGGYGFIISEDSRTVTHRRIYTEGEMTPSKCELLAVIRALNYAQTNGYAHDILYVFTDSQYVQRGLKEWLPKWKKNEFRTSSSNRPIMHQELWLKLERLTERMNVHISWVRAHNGNDNFNAQIDREITAHLKAVNKKTTAQAVTKKKSKPAP